MWKVRKAFWNWLTVKKFLANTPEEVPVPTDDVRKVSTIPMRVRYPGIPIDNILVADHVPGDEKQPLKLLFIKFQTFLYKVYPPEKQGLPSISADPFTALRSAYGLGHRAHFPPPALPKEYQGPIDLGQLAVAGPYSYYLQAVPGAAPGTSYEWDFRHLGQFEHHHGLRSLGVRVRFEVDDDQLGVSAVEIECELGLVTPTDPRWEKAQELALCAATNHMTLVRHFNWVHLATVSHSAVATRNSLPAEHRLRRLLWPHLWGTQYSNELVTEVLMMKGGDYEKVFSFTHAGLCELFARTYDEYDINTFDPDADIESRGLKCAPFPQPAFENRLAHFDVMHRHACSYLRAAYPSDAAIRADAAVVAWVADLNRRLPGGALAGEITVERVARLAAILMYVGTVEHEVMGTGLWNYQLWSQVQPVRVRKDGRRVPLDEFQRLVNFNYTLNVNRAPLVQNFDYLAVDRDGGESFRSFLKDLRKLQGREQAERYAHWRVSPDILESSVNG